MKYITTVGDKEYLVEILGNNRVSVDGNTCSVDFESVSGHPVFTLLVDGKSYEAHILPEEDEWQVMLQGTLYTAVVEDEREKRLRAAAGSSVAETGEFNLKSPMPGLVVKLEVNVGDEVKKGDVLLILESMKMQNELKAPRDGKVMRVSIKDGDSVEQKQHLLSLE